MYIKCTNKKLFQKINKKITKRNTFKSKIKNICILNTLFQIA